MSKKMTKTILKALIDQDLTITKLAKKIERSRVYTSNVVNGRFSRLPVATIKRIAEALNIPAKELLSDGNDNKRLA
jgi:transcriptional regulator with XRE-family HTH domain